MYHPDKRTQSVRTFAERLEESAGELAQDLVLEVQMAHRFAAAGHVPEAARLLRCFDGGDGLPFHPSLRTGERRALGSVAIQLGDDAPLTGLARAAGAAFVAGNRQVIVNLPPTCIELTSRLARLAEDLLPGVIFTAEMPDAFLLRSLTDAFTRAIWWAGDPVMVLPYGALIRDTRTRFIAEAATNDPAVVGNLADVGSAATAIVEAAFRNGGRDPARIGRVYATEGVYKALVAAIREGASALTVAQPADASADVSPLASVAARVALLEWLDDADDADASVDVDLNFRHFGGDSMPVLYPTVVSDCAPHLSIVRNPKQGAVLPIVRVADGENLAAAVAEGGQGCAISLFGASPDEVADFAGRYTHVFTDSTAFSADNAHARHHWGGTPGFVVDPDGRVRTGPQVLVAELSEARPTRRDRPATSPAPTPRQLPV